MSSRAVAPNTGQLWLVSDSCGSAGVEWKRDQRRPDIRKSEDSILNFFTQPAFFLIGGGAVLTLLIIFFLLELTG